MSRGQKTYDQKCYSAKVEYIMYFTVFSAAIFINIIYDYI